MCLTSKMTSEVKVMKIKIVEDINIGIHAKIHKDPLNSYWENAKNVQMGVRLTSKMTSEVKVMKREIVEDNDIVIHAKFHGNRCSSFREKWEKR